MNRKEYDRILQQRLAGEQAEEAPQAEITVVYTEPSLVQAGQKLMKQRRTAAAQPPTPMQKLEPA